MRCSNVVPRLMSAVAALALGGCVTHGALSNRAVDYNTAAETARNEMLLMNILRARDRRPMVFTGLSRITGSVRAESRIGAAVSTGSAAPDVQAFSPSFGFSDSPTFDVAVLDSQEFTRGIMTPVGTEILEYFWDQGYNREVLLYLVVDRVELECPAPGSALSAVLENDPTEPSFAAFGSLVADLADKGRWEFDDFRTEKIGPPVDAAEARRLPTLVQMANSPLRLRPVGDGTFQLEKTSTKLRLAASGSGTCGKQDRVEVRLYDSRGALEAAARLAPGEPRGRLVMRSPQSILHYLGELARPEREVVIRPRRPDQPASERRLFAVRPAGACSGSEVNVRYDGGKWAIPRGTADCDAGRSMQSLAITAQLLSLLQSAKDLPTTSTVRIVGQ
ncbi:MAG: hypothetical protein IPL90_18890 [Holophagales bacterium]|nr:hypothetical protein [Holophagales bacterium]